MDVQSGFHFVRWYINEVRGMLVKLLKHIITNDIGTRLAKEHNSDFSKVAITNQIAGVIA